MKFFIALDSGGYKTQSVLFDETGTVYAFDYGRGANAFDIGPEEATSRLCFSIDTMKNRLPAGEKLSGIFGSVSAVFYYPEIEERVAKHVGLSRCKLDSIVCSVMAPILGKDDGVCLISGTGSYCCVRQAGEHRKYIGSSGYMLDTGGSGFVLGRQALIATQRERDGRGPKTLLTEILEAEMGETLREHLPVIYAGGRTYISSFAHAVFSARKQGDAVAARIFNEGVSYYEEDMQTAYRIMGKPFKAALGGGLFINVPEYAQAVSARAPEGCELKVLDTPTLYGAALEAMWLCGEGIPAGFKTRFIETYNAQPNLHTGW